MELGELNTFVAVAGLDILEVRDGTIDIGVTTRQRVPAPLSSAQMPVASAGFCVLLPRRPPFASQRELTMAMLLHSERLVTRAGVPRLVVIPLSPARAASALRVVYRDNHGQPTALGDFLEAVRITGEHRTSRNAPIGMRSAR
jgi:DNA-binding transcriptional LysR family regulator